MEHTDPKPQPRYYGPFIAMNWPDGTVRLTPARKTDHGYWVPLSPAEVEAAKR